MVFGIIGALLIVGSYALMQFDRLDARTPQYALINAAGALLILLSLIHDFNLGAALVESFWLVVSVLGFIRAKRRNEY